jgi:SNF2 family DNA or RNA helicase
MLILHGAWIAKQNIDESGMLFIWAETAGTGAETKSGKTAGGLERHPFAADPADMKQILCEFMTAELIEETFVLSALLYAPSGSRPCSSPERGMFSGDKALEKPEVKAWQVKGIGIPAYLALTCMRELAQFSSSENIVLGQDVKFWLAAFDWVRALVIEQKYIPGISRYLSSGYEAEGAIWRPYLVGDAEKVACFTQAMPAACHSVYFKSASSAGEERVNGRTALLSFVQFMLNAVVKEALTGYSYAGPPTKRAREKEWLQALADSDDKLPGMAGKYENLFARLAAWSAPAELATEGLRTCFRLEEPEEESEAWRLSYWLQALDDLSLIIPAEAVWLTADESFTYWNRRWPNQQRQLLTDLIKAGEIFKPIAASLNASCPVESRINIHEAHAFLREASVLLRQAGFGVIVPNWWREQRSNRKLGVKLSVKDEPSHHSFVGRQAIAAYDMEVALGEEVLDLQELERIIDLKTPLVNSQGQWLEILPEQAMLAANFLRKKTSGKMKLNQVLQVSVTGHSGGITALEGLPVVSVTMEGRIKELVDRLTGMTGLPEITIPTAFRGQLRPYQSRGVAWLWYLRQLGLGACLADDMGLGKTVQLIAYLLYVQDHEAVTGPALILCPMSVVGNWQRELAKFAPGLTVYVHHGGDRLSGEAFTQAATEYDVVISTYTLAARDAGTLAAVNWEHVILDEAQNIKNVETKQTISIRRLFARQKIALTGTPVENRLSELWSIIDFLNDGYLGSLPGFKHRYAVPIERYGDKDKRHELHKLVQPFILRRIKSDKDIIPELPDKQETKVYCRLTTEQATLYGAILETMLPQIDAADFITRKALIAATLVKLKQICNHPVNFLHDNSTIHGRSGKLSRLMEMLAELQAEGRRALVFTQYAEMGQLLKRYLESSFAQPVLFLHGRVNKAERDEMVRCFQEDEFAPQIFVLSLKAGGVGLNLTRADTVFHFDRWWNPAVENQATDRAFRIGQKQNVQVYKFICEGTIEEKIDEMISSKQALADAVVGSGETWLTEMSADELRKVLALRADSIGE